MRKIEKPSVRIYARVYDEELLTEMEHLVQNGSFDSKSDIVGRCIELALPVLAGRTGKDASGGQREYDIAKAVKQQSAALRELSVQTTMAFNLLVGLFRERELTLCGTRTNGQDLAEGKYEILSEYYRDRMNELMKML